MRVIIFDSGTLINFSLNSSLDVIEKLRKVFKGKFIITKEVEYEVVSRPMKIKKYKLGAMKVKQLIDSRVLEFPESIGVNSKEVSIMTKKIMSRANNVFYTDKKSVHLIDLGESSCLALGKILDEKKIESVIAIDERTTRLLCESPDALRSIMEKKLHARIDINKSENEYFRSFNFIRSPELIYVAFKKGIISGKSRDLLDAFLYGAKFKGASISDEEIRQIESMGV